jgi:hypothetical protein
VPRLSDGLGSSGPTVCPRCAASASVRCVRCVRCVVCVVRCVSWRDHCGWDRGGRPRPKADGFSKPFSARSLSALYPRSYSGQGPTDTDVVTHRELGGLSHHQPRNLGVMVESCAYQEFKHADARHIEPRAGVVCESATRTGASMLTYIYSLCNPAVQTCSNHCLAWSEFVHALVKL